MTATNSRLRAIPAYTTAIQPLANISVFAIFTADKAGTASVAAERWAQFQMTFKFYHLLIFPIVLCSCTTKPEQSSSAITNAEESEASLQIPFIDAPDSYYDIIEMTIDLDSIEAFENQQVRILDSMRAPYGNYMHVLIDTVLLKKYTEYKVVRPYLEELTSKANEQTAFNLNHQKLKEFEVVYTDSIDVQSLHLGISVEPFYMFSAPLISNDHRLIVISVDLLCSGLCGEGYFIFLFNDNNKWVRVGKVLGWIG